MENREKGRGWERKVGRKGGEWIQNNRMEDNTYGGRSAGIVERREVRREGGRKEGREEWVEDKD